MRLIDADVISTDEIVEHLYCGQCYRHIQRMLEEQPTVDLVRHGHWIYVKGSNGKAYDVCSVCGHTQETMGVNNYCPDCGAKMDEVIE